MNSQPVLLGAHAAKSCARVTHNVYDVTVPRQPRHVHEELQRLFDVGIGHEAAVFGAWLALDSAVVDLRLYDVDPHGHVAATVEAMRRGVAVILGGRLPDDPIGGRAGKPDALIKDQSSAGYHACDVKAHKVLDIKKSDGLIGDLSRPALSQARIDGRGLRHKLRDLLQLAHYQRMLEACGFAATEPCGAIVGTEVDEYPILAWYDLDAPVFITFSRSEGKKSRSSLQRYDHEHEFRVRVARVAQQRVDGADDPAPLVDPVGQEECLSCSWAPVCVDLLPAGDLSRELRGALSVREYLALRREGVDTMSDLLNAELDDLLASSYAEETSNQRDRAGRLYQAHMAAQLARDGVVLRLKPDAIFDVPFADIEVDIDMECTRGGRVYLWGVLVSEAGVSSYKAFSNLSVESEVDEVAVAVAFFDWLAENYPAATVFHYAPVERSQAIRILGSRLASYIGTVADPHAWIDLLPAARTCLDSRGGHGLKVVAAEGAGFRWRDEDPGGLQSQVWLDAARGGDESAWQRILDYNEDDVRATLAVRKFLRSAAAR